MPRTKFSELRESLSPEAQARVRERVERSAMSRECEPLSRVRMMADDDLTWDLSKNDIAALKWVLAALDEMRHALDACGFEAIAGADGVRVVRIDREVPGFTGEKEQKA